MPCAAPSATGIVVVGPLGDFVAVGPREVWGLRGSATGHPPAVGAADRFLLPLAHLTNGTNQIFGSLTENGPKI